MTAAPEPPESTDEPPEGRRPPGRDRGRAIGAGVGVLVAAGVVVLLAIGLANKDVGTSINDALDSGTRVDAPSLTLPLLVGAEGVGRAGEPLSLSRLRGRVVVLNYWASWCRPCEAEAPILEQVWRDYRDRGVVVLGLDVQDLSDEALTFVREFGLTYPSVRDGPGDSREDFEVTGVPETFIIDKQGRIAVHRIGEYRAREELTVPLDQIVAE